MVKPAITIPCVELLLGSSAAGFVPRMRGDGEGMYESPLLLQRFPANALQLKSTYCTFAIKLGLYAVKWFNPVIRLRSE